jgi:DNA modification methylase
LPTLEAESVNCIVTSPPYYGLRDYGCEGQIGLEQTPEGYVAELVAVFREARRVLRADGTCWLNLGDSYASFRDGRATPDTTRKGDTGTLVDSGKAKNRSASTFAGSCVKHKDLIGIPWRVAFALQSDGWYLRQDIIWHKPNPMPESVTDRCTKAHEYLFLLTKSERYWYDAGAICEASVTPMDSTARQSFGGPKLSNSVLSHAANHGKARRDERKDTRNRRSVWTIPTQPCSLAHFAVMPEALVEPCILAGCPSGGTVLDPFGGSGTVGAVAEKLGRNSVLIELNPAYIELQKVRTAQQGMSI